MAIAKTRARVQEAAIVEDDAPAIRGVPAGRAVVKGRDGKPVFRRMAEDGDRFAIDPAIVPDGWSYEWKRWSIYNQEDKGYMARLSGMGWTAVPAERHAGLFMPHDYKGSIIFDGLILMERPIELTIEARAEDKKKADKQVYDAKRLHGLVPNTDGIRTDTQAVRTNTFVKSHRDAGLDIPRPKRELAID